MEIVFRALWGYWWLRGVLAALGLLLFAREFLGFTPFESAAAILATLALWNEALTWIGAVIGQLPWIPALTADQMLYLSLLLTFSVPAAFRSVHDLGVLLDATARQYRLAKIGGELAELEGRSGIRATGRRRALRSEKARLSDESSFVEVLLSLLLFFAAGGSTGLLIALLILPSLEFGELTLLLLSGAVAIAFALACRIRGYFIGAVTLAGFLFVVQLAVVLDAPWVHQWVNSRAEAEIHRSK